MKKHPTFNDVIIAHDKIKKYIHKTPILTSSSINKMFDSTIYFKCENFQKTGSFKFRGAINSLLSLSENNLLSDVCTHSSGNHAAALSLAAKKLKIKAHIVIFSNAAANKINAVKYYGGKITFCKPTLSQRVETLQKVKEEKKAIEVHSSSQFSTICGQGTVAKELLEEVKVNMIIPPIGGGGLLSGTAIFTKSSSPQTKIIGAEPLNANDAFLSVKSGKLIIQDTPQTICDGLLPSLSPYTFSIINSNVDTILTAKESTIKKAMRLIWDRLKIVVEPSACVPLAVLLENPTLVRGQKVGIILSGGNINTQNLV